MTICTFYSEYIQYTRTEPSLQVLCRNGSAKRSSDEIALVLTLGILLQELSEAGLGSSTIQLLLIADLFVASSNNDHVQFLVNFFEAKAVVRHVYYQFVQDLLLAPNTDVRRNFAL